MTAILLRIKRFTAFIIGAIYFISGILKLLDPVGSGLVMQEYFNFLHISFLDFAAKVVGCAFAFAEAVIGIALITGVWRKLFANIAIVVQICFTFLTLILLVFQADMDCGCFGEAVELTHSETFIKNLLLLAFIIFALFPVDELGSPKKRKYASFSIVSISTLVFTIYSWVFIPLVAYTDFCKDA